MIAMKHVLVPTDFGEPADAALTYGRELAGRFGATLHVLNVADSIFVTSFGVDRFAVMAQRDFEESMRVRLRKRVMTVDGSGPPATVAVVTSASPATAILDYAKENGVDLIVMGTHGRGGLAQMLMGSVAERVVRLASCPVLIVHNPKREVAKPSTLMPIAHVMAQA
jgi:nucleotide-binding universal stress UspA family protein